MGALDEVRYGGARETARRVCRDDLVLMAAANVIQVSPCHLLAVPADLSLVAAGQLLGVVAGHWRDYSQKIDLGMQPVNEIDRQGKRFLRLRATVQRDKDAPYADRLAGLSQGRPRPDSQNRDGGPAQDFVRNAASAITGDGTAPMGADGDHVRFPILCGADDLYSGVPGPDLNRHGHAHLVEQRG